MFYSILDIIGNMIMKTRLLFITVFFFLGLGSCKQECCTVKGTVQGVKDGAELVLQDDWNKCKVISTTMVFLRAKIPGGKCVLC